MKTHLFIPEVPVFIVEFLVTFRLPCDTNYISKSRSTWVSSDLVHNTIANVLYSCMYAQSSFAPSGTSSRNQKQPSQKLLRSYLEAGNYLLKRFATYQTIAEYDVSILRYREPLRVSLEQYGDDTITKSCKTADIYDESKLNNILIEDVDSSTRHIFCSYLVTQPQTDLTDIEIQMETLLAIQEGSDNLLTENEQQTRLEKPSSRKPYDTCHGANNFENGYNQLTHLQSVTKL